MQDLTVGDGFWLGVGRLLGEAALFVAVLGAGIAILLAVMGMQALWRRLTRKPDAR